MDVIFKQKLSYSSQMEEIAQVRLKWILRLKAKNLCGAFFIFKYLIFSERLVKFIFVRRHLISTDVIFCIELHIIIFIYNLIYFILKIILMDNLI
jgi:hypothetical protein